MRLLISVPTAALLLSLVPQFGLAQAQVFSSKPQAAPLAKRSMKKNKKRFPAVKGELLVKLSTSALAKSSTAFSEIAASLEKTLGLKTKISIRPLRTSSEFAVLRVSESSFEKEAGRRLLIPSLRLWPSPAAEGIADFERGAKCRDSSEAGG